MPNDITTSAAAQCICDKCGQEISLSEWPFCPHGESGHGVIADDVPGGFVVENGFDEPTRFYSHSEHRKALAARGLEIKAKWAGEHDRHLTRWDAVSADQLEKARELVSRPRTKATTPEAEAIPITRTTLPERFRVEANA